MVTRDPAPPASATAPPLPSHPVAQPGQSLQPGAGERVKAYLDIGTNSIRLLLVRILPNHAYAILSQQKEVVRLGEGEFIDGHLQPEAMQRAVLVCRMFADMARSYGADAIQAVATSATREAKNQREFLRRLEQEAGLRVHVVGGLEEARLIYLGVASGLHLADRRALVIDIGGGSTELAIGGQAQHEALDSLKLGAIRLTSMFFLPGEADPVSPARYELLLRYVRGASIRNVQRLRPYLPVDLAVASSGTAESLAEMAARQWLKRPYRRGDTLSRDQVAELARRLCALPLEERRAVPGLNPSRADIIIAGAAILEVLMSSLGVEQLELSERGLREGLIVDDLERSHPELHQGRSVRQQSVLRLGRTCGFDEAHAGTVARLALALFDSAARLRLHPYGAAERELLEHAAMLHDIGVSVAYSNHHAHSFYLIQNAELLGFDQSEIALVALIARFHRKREPSRKADAAFAALDRRGRRLVRRLSLFLRLAENLDRSHAGLVRDVAFEALDDKRIALTVRADADSQLELWAAQGNALLFKKVTGRELLIRPLAT